jgi:DNA repair protein RecN (Recombination protein N)
MYARASSTEVEMLLELRIDNIAVIESVVIPFGPGLNAITGETGAGKSVLLVALGLLAGDKGGGDVVRSGAITAAVEARYRLSDPDRIGQLLRSHGLDDWQPGPELVVRRTISVQGGGRATVDGTPVRLPVLKALGALLVDGGQQHAQQLLLDGAFHLELLDGFAGLGDARAAMAGAWTLLTAARSQRLSIEQQAGDRASRLDWLRFQVNELRQHKLLPGEVAALQVERERLRSGAERALACAAAEASLRGDVGGVCGAIARAEARLRAAATLDGQLAGPADALRDARGLVDDVLRDLQGLAGGTADEPRRLEALEDRLADLRHLARKHRVEPDDLVELSLRLAAELDGIEQFDAHLAEAQDAEARAERDALAAAAVLRDARLLAAPRLGADVLRGLFDLDLRDARFDVQVLPLAELGPRGTDQIQFCLSTNPGEPLRCLSKVASGGELSRVLLALRAAARVGLGGTTAVFDEIDAGMGGAAARAVGRRLREIAWNDGGQVLCVTHQANIAALADHHVAVVKRIEGGRAFTDAQQVEGESRVDEVGRMVGGRGASRLTLMLARELLGAAEPEQHGHAAAG